LLPGDAEMKLTIQEFQLVSPKMSAFRVALIYVLLGVLWILLSDKLVSAFVRGEALITKAQTIKGWFYVAVTGVLLYFLVLRDMARQARVEAELRKVNETLTALLKACPSAVVALDSEGKILMWHPLAERIANRGESEVLGASLEAVFGPLGFSAELDSLFKQALSGRVITDVEVLARSPEGRTSAYSASAAPVYSESGRERPSGVVIVLHDITERRRSELELAQLNQRLLDAEQQKKRFYREVIRAVTNGKLHLVEPHEIPTSGEKVLDEPVRNAEECTLTRRRIREIGLQAGLTPDDASDLESAVGEALVNAVKHGVDAHCTVFLDGERISVRVADRGRGIRPEDLPASVLRPGFSTTVSMGMGYTIMLETADQIWLSTGPEGTVVQVEKAIKPEARPEPPINAALRRLWSQAN
jgi:PAS domain S-box-containing protein